MTIFFTLSGFLITTLLLEEHETTGRIRLMAFYERRARRLGPALLLFLGTLALLSALSESPLAPSTRDLLGALFYVSNFTGAMAGNDSAVLHTWSLAVEEQFYIVWPLLMIAAMARGRRRALVVATVAFVGYALVARPVVWDGGLNALRVLYSTDMRMDGLLVGCLTAFWVRRGAVEKVTSPWALAAMLLFLPLTLVPLAPEHLLVPALVPWLTALVLVGAVSTEPTWLTWAPLRLLGRRSYAMYLWHFPLFAIASAVPGHWAALACVVAFCWTAAIAELSWRCIEMPFLARRDERAADEAPAARVA